ncbi:hypothetical protein E2562_029322 [Oryza meyeriana var. granulata]|uniref:Uncharacterized protein n=1 Tax=Oryza meyeriana var. granulata TaxID=110450 RepID=A0A6G1E2Q7_9ORYZ|nr:hypothetical protein E2562_029322 [Oryza meyeriana var. granulata]
MATRHARVVFDSPLARYRAPELKWCGMEKQADRTVCEEARSGSEGRLRSTRVGARLAAPAVAG